MPPRKNAKKETNQQFLNFDQAELPARERGSETSASPTPDQVSPNDSPTATPVASTPKSEKSIASSFPAQPALGESTQQVLEFMESAPLPAISVETQMDLSAAFLKDFGLDKYDLTLRPGQPEFFKEVLGHNDPSKTFVGHAKTGAGKSLIMRLKSALHLQGGQKVIICSPLKTVLHQLKGEFEKFFEGQSIELRVITGESSELERKLASGGAFDILFITEQTLTKLLPDFTPSNIGTVLVDEFHEASDADGAFPLDSHLRRHLEQATRFIFSASPLKKNKDQPFYHSIKPYTPCSLQPEDLEKTQPRAIQTKQNVHLIHRVVEVPLTDRLRPVAHAIRNSLNPLLKELYQARGGARLYPLPDDNYFFVPSLVQRSQLLSSTPSFKKGGSLQGWAHLYDVVTRKGEYDFLEWYCYRLVRYQLEKEIFLPEIEGKKKNGELRGGLRRSDIEILKSDELRLAVEPLLNDTPFEGLYDLKDLNSLLSALQIHSHPLSSAKSLPLVTEERRRPLRLTRNHKDQEVKKLRLFFDEALRYFAYRELSDSTKLQAVSELLETHFHEIRDGHTFLFLPNTRTAEFYGEALSYRFGSAGLAPVVVHGKYSDSHNQALIQQFSNGERNLLITTPHYAGTGLDVSNPIMAIVAGMPSGSSNTVIQAIGRVAPRANKKALIYFLGTTGTGERERYEQGIASFEKLEKAFINRSHVVIPTFKAGGEI